MIEGKQALLKRAAQAGPYPRKAASDVCMSSGGGRDAVARGIVIVKTPALPAP